MDIGVSVGPYAERIDRLGGPFAFVELAVGEGERSREDLDTAAVAARAAAVDAEVVTHLPYRQPLSTPVDRLDEATLSYLEALLDDAAAMGVSTAVAHPSARGAGHATDRLVDRLSALTAAGRERGITVCFETLGHAGGLDLDRLGSVAAEADASLCLDVGYAYLEAGADGVERFLAAHGDRVEHLHVHGARHRGDTHIPLGSGDVEIDAIGTALATHADDPTATVEVFTDDPRYLDLSARRFRQACASA